MSLHLAPVPLSIFRSNSKFGENSECSSFDYTRPITTIFCTRHDSDTVVACAKYRCDRPRIFYTRVFWIFIEYKFDRNMLSGTGASPSATAWQRNKFLVRSKMGNGLHFMNYVSALTVPWHFMRSNKLIENILWLLEIDPNLWYPIYVCFYSKQFVRWWPLLFML